MSRYARVIVESDLVQLDREFDFIIPEALASRVAIGQRVKFPLGRTKKAQTGFITQVTESSNFATSELLELVDETSVLQNDVYELCKQVAARQCVATGELLKSAIPDHMPRIEVSKRIVDPLPIIDFPVQLPKLGQRAAVLTSARSISHQGIRESDWCWLFAQQAYAQLSQGKSSILLVPEIDQVNQLSELLSQIGLGQHVIRYVPSAKKSDRFIAFRQTLDAEAVIVIGTRSAIYAPVQKLGLIALFDDADDSFREQGSPFTHVRDLAMMRAGKNLGLLIAANYRSLEVQRLVEIGYLTDSEVAIAPPRISFSEPGVRVDSASFKLIRESITRGPVLILLPRKGESSTIYCAGCDSRLKCAKCSGPMWEPTSGKYQCRLCQSFAFSCSQCGSSQTRRGRTGSTRTVAEIGKAFPGVYVIEATADKKPGRIRNKNHIVIATPGSAPRVQNGYSALIVLDTDVWLAVPLIRAEQNGIRDWMEAIELLSDDGRAHLSNLDRGLGQAISLWQHRALASQALSELGKLQLPPATRVVSIESDSQTISSAIAQLTEIGAVVLRSDLSPEASALLRFSYSAGPQVASTLRALALKTNARLVGGNKRRGLRIVMDDPIAL